MLKKFFKKFFPRIYYSERLQKAWFYIMLPSPIKYLIIILILLIFILIWNGVSTDDVKMRLTGHSNADDEIFKDKNK